MFCDESETGARCNCMLLVLVSAMSLALLGCGEQAAPPLKQAEVVLTVEQEFAASLVKANAGDADAQFNLGSMYAFGEGVPKIELSISISSVCFHERRSKLLLHS